MESYGVTKRVDNSASELSFLVELISLSLKGIPTVGKLKGASMHVKSAILSQGLDLVTLES